MRAGWELCPLGGLLAVLRDLEGRHFHVASLEDPPLLVEQVVEGQDLRVGSWQAVEIGELATLILLDGGDELPQQLLRRYLVRLVTKFLQSNHILVRDLHQFHFHH